MNFLIVVMLLIFAVVILKRIDHSVRIGEANLFGNAAEDGLLREVKRAASPATFWTIVSLQGAIALAATGLAVWRATHGER